MAKKINLIGSWAFLVGVIIALIIGVCSGLEIADLSSPFLTSVLVVIGLIIGLFNVADKEAMPFLMSGVALIIAGFFGAQIMVTIPVAVYTLGALLLMFIPATIIVAIKNVFSLAKN
jgi:hypothetical protein